jgi:hypothetical protein
LKLTFAIEAPLVWGVRFYRQSDVRDRVQAYVPHVIAAALAVALSAAALLGAAPRALADAPVHNYRGVVPVLVYHGIHANPDPSSDPYSISQQEFATHMATLAAAGFHAISIGQYARFAAGYTAVLPDRPILITFDDGRLDSYRGADAALGLYGMRATMFVITAKAAASARGYLSWAQLRAMAAGGRWDVQEHAHAGHVRIPTGPGGRTGPYYANLIYRNGTREWFSVFKRRVTSDILAGRSLLASQVPGFEPLAFAVPYGNYGQQSSNYAPIPAWLASWLTRAFNVVFVQDHAVYNLPGNQIGQRYAIRASTTAGALLEWLAEALPASAWVAPTSPTRPKRPSLRKRRVGRRVVLLVFKVRKGTKLKATRRRAGRRHRVRVTVGARGRLRDRRLRPHTAYVYRVVALGPAGRRSAPLVIRVRTRPSL